jgi:lysozyme
MPDPLNVIVDLSHFNGNVDLAQAKAAGIMGVIHKGTQGLTYIDPMYKINHAKAQAAGLLWGTYHFGVGADGAQQADYFLKQVQPGPQDLLILDFESNPQGPSMTLDQARAFINHINTTVGRLPGFYSGYYIREQLGNNHDPLLASCWFWLAQYAPVPNVPAPWNNWTLWQYTNGGMGSGPYDVPGIGRCDRSHFNGDLDALHKLWGVEPAGA